MSWSLSPEISDFSPYQPPSTSKIPFSDTHLDNQLLTTTRDTIAKIAKINLSRSCHATGDTIANAYKAIVSLMARRFGRFGEEVLKWDIEIRGTGRARRQFYP